MREKTGRGKEGETGRGPLPQPEPREPPRIPAPPWTAHGGGEWGCGLEERETLVHACARRGPAGKTVEAGVRASKGGPKTEKLAPRQGIWGAGGETRLHREKTGLDLGVRREAEAEGQEEKGGRERRSQVRQRRGRQELG